MTKQELENIKVRATSLESIENPEWGTFGVFEDRGGWFVIGNSRGSRVLHKTEALRFWKIHETDSSHA